jgi:hypothetical protein
VLALVDRRGWPSVRRSELRPAILDYVNAHDGALFIVWDEPEGSTGNIPLIVLGPHVKHGKVKGRDASELSRELRRLLADPDLRVKLGDAGHEAVASRHGAVRDPHDLAACLARARA